MRNQSVTYSTAKRRKPPSRPYPIPHAAPSWISSAAAASPPDRSPKPFPYPVPAISKHLRLLRRAHLVREHREGRNRVYELNPEPLRAVDSWIEQYRVFWLANLNSLKSFVEAEYDREQTQASRKPKP